MYIEDLELADNYNRNPEEDEPAFGTTRAVISYIPQDDREYIVVGENRSSGITSGENYIITDKSDNELVSQLGGEENTTRWAMRFFSFVLLTFGFTSMLSPILVFTDWIPVAGQIARGAATFLSAIIAGIIVLSTVFLLNYWWIVGLSLFLIVILFVGFSVFTKKEKTIG